MRSAIRFLLVLACYQTSFGQTTDQDRDISWKKLVPNILEDQKNIWLFPFHLAQGRAWAPTLAVSALTTGLVVGADAPVAHYFRNTDAFHGFNQVFTSTATSAAIFAAPAALYATGLIRKDSKMSNTALLAGEAVADSEILIAVVKPAVDRVRPSALPPNANFHDTFSEGGDRFSGSYNSFPSGHAIAAFSVATVIARRYGRKHRWVPVVAYGGAALIGLSRLTLSAHYVSDVFIGGALGYSIGRFAVLRQ
jgi:membrane-associated phospholipid phosphatase